MLSSLGISGRKNLANVGFYRNQAFIKKIEEKRKAKESGEKFMGFYYAQKARQEAEREQSRKDSIQENTTVEVIQTEDHQGEKDNL